MLRLPKKLLAGMLEIGFVCCVICFESQGLVD